MSKLPKSFYQQPALEIVQDFLGKYLVFNSPQGKISGRIIDVEAYPAFYDQVSHGNKRTNRTEIMFQSGGHAYIYVIYGIHHQLAVVVNTVDIPEAVFIRALIPTEGLELMHANFGKPVKHINHLTKSPGNLCKSFGIDISLYGIDLTEDHLYIEDRGEIVDPSSIKVAKRIGINPNLAGWDKEVRYYITS